MRIQDKTPARRIERMQGTLMKMVAQLDDVESGKGRSEGTMTLTNEEQIHRNRLEYLLINSGPFDIAIRKAIAYALDLIEEKEKAP